MKKKTRIVVQIDADSAHRIYLRGEGPSELSWDKGVELKKEHADEWVFETDNAFTTGEFKVLVNDQTFELGESHSLYPGASMRINPKFPEA